MTTIVRAMIQRKGKFLLVKRSEKLGNSMWQFVGGHTDNQSRLQALKREVKEEVNLNVYGEPKQIVKFINPVTNKKTVFYETKGRGRIKLQKEEVSRYGWFTPKQIKNLSTTFSTKKVLRRL